MLLSEITAFHGSGKNLKKLKPPFFVTTSKIDARWFAINRSDDGNGFIMTGELNVQNVLDLIDGSGPDLLDIARSAGIEFEEDPYFFSQAIADASHYDGTNSSDLIYIPAFQAELKKRGYDSMRFMDVMGNDEIEVYVLFNPAQFKVTGAEPVTALSESLRRFADSYK